MYQPIYFAKISISWQLFGVWYVFRRSTLVLQRVRYSRDIRTITLATWSIEEGHSLNICQEAFWFVNWRNLDLIWWYFRFVWPSFKKKKKIWSLNDSQEGFNHLNWTDWSIYWLSINRSAQSKIWITLMHPWIFEFPSRTKYLRSEWNDSNTPNSIDYLAFIWTYSY